MSGALSAALNSWAQGERRSFFKSWAQKERRSFFIARAHDERWSFKRAQKTNFQKKTKHSIKKYLHQQYQNLKFHVLPIKGYRNEHKTGREYNLVKKKWAQMSAKWAHVFFQERKMSAGIFVSASESAAHVSEKERYHERRS